MIRVVIFDLDGTLVQTEKLKALSYARAAAELKDGQLDKEEVIEAYREAVGLGRRELALSLVQRFGLEKPARSRMKEFGVKAPWQAFLQVRHLHYQTIMDDMEIVRASRCSHCAELLKDVKRRGIKAVLATMATCAQVNKLLVMLQWTDEFDLVVTRDDVNYGKPNPEVFQAISREMEIDPYDCLVIEDSPDGLEAGLMAGMWVIASTTDFTRQAVHNKKLVPEDWIVDRPEELVKTAALMFRERQQEK